MSNPGSCLYVTADGDSLWLECFGADPEHGQPVRSLDPGDTWEDIRNDIRHHRCAGVAADDQLVDEATRLDTIHDRIADLFPHDPKAVRTPESAVDHLITQFRTTAEAESAIARRLGRLESDLRGITTVVGDNNLDPAAVVAAIRKLLAHTAAEVTPC